MPCAAGNNGDLEDPYNPKIEYPARFDDDWVTAVGGTGLSGTWCGVDPLDGFVSQYGSGIDVAAPAASSIIVTTSVDTTSSHPWGSYDNANGTSSSTAYVSGVSCLILSYLNDSVDAYKNLSPEDVEFILEHSATYVGHDSATGAGRLNAGNALSLIDTSKRRIYHFDSDSVVHSNTLTLVQSNIPLKLTERARSDVGTLFNRMYYKADIYKVQSTISISVGSDSIQAFWPRPSSSDLFYYDNTDSLLPHEKVIIENINSSQAVLSGYLFKLYDSLSNPIGWLPTDTNNISNINFAISVLCGDSIPLWNGVVTTNCENLSLQLYPNPMLGEAIVDVVSNCNGRAKLAVFDMHGRVIYNIFDGNLEEARRFKFSIAHAQSAMYYVGMNTSCGNKFVKFIKL